MPLVTFEFWLWWHGRKVVNLRRVQWDMIMLPNSVILLWIESAISWHRKNEASGFTMCNSNEWVYVWSPSKQFVLLSFSVAACDIGWFISKRFTQRCRASSFVYPQDFVPLIHTVLGSCARDCVMQSRNRSVCHNAPTTPVTCIEDSKVHFGQRFHLQTLVLGTLGGMLCKGVMHHFFYILNKRRVHWDVECAIWMKCDIYVALLCQLGSQSGVSLCSFPYDSFSGTPDSSLVRQFFDWQAENELVISLPLV